MPNKLVALVLLSALALPQPASALPRSMEAFDVQMQICRTGLEMVLNGATDDEETQFFIEQLDHYGWTEEGDLDDLMLLCAFYKQGWLLYSNEYAN